MDAYIEKINAEWSSELNKKECISLWEPNKMPGRIIGQTQEPSIVPYFMQGNEYRGAVIICAGGAYIWKEPLEAFPHAIWLNSIGLHAFVLDYRVKPYKIEDALTDAQRAVRIIRSKSDEWKIKKDKIAILGFSSGGHLAAMASTHFDTGISDSLDSIESESSRPDAQILCYAHITYSPYIKDDPDFIKNFFGENYIQSDIDRVNANLHVKADTPPAFIWGMHDDWQFKQKHWSLYADALDEYNIPYSYHVFPKGSHNEAREASSPIWKQWTYLCEMWLREMQF